MQLSTDKGRQTQNPRKFDETREIDKRYSYYPMFGKINLQLMAVISILSIFLACVVVKLRGHCKPFTQEFLHRAKNSEEKSLSGTWTLQFLL